MKVWNAIWGWISSFFNGVEIVLGWGVTVMILGIVYLLIIMRAMQVQTKTSYAVSGDSIEAKQGGRARNLKVMPRWLYATLGTLYVLATSTAVVALIVEMGPIGLLPGLVIAAGVGYIIYRAAS